MGVVWTRYAEERQQEWEKRLGITRREVEDFLCNPEQVVPGDRNALVTQVRRGRGVLRVPYQDRKRQENLDRLLDELSG